MAVMKIVMKSGEIREYKPIGYGLAGNYILLTLDRRNVKYINFDEVSEFDIHFFESQELVDGDD